MKIHYDEAMRGLAYFPYLMQQVRRHVTDVQIREGYVLHDSKFPTEMQQPQAGLFRRRLQCQLSAMRHFELEGQQVYCCSEKASAVLSSTRLDRVTPADICMPHGCFWIEVPGWGVPNEHGEIMYGGYVRDLRADAFGANLTAVLGFETRLDDPANVGVASLYLDGTDDLESAIQRWKTQVPEDGHWVEPWWRLVLNLLLYLYSDRPDLQVDESRVKAYQELEAAIGRAKSPGKKKKLARRLEKQSRCVVTYVAPFLENETSEPSDGTGNARRQHLVRPHWHRYWVGPKDNQKCILKWVRMHVRGREPAPERHVTVL